MEEKNKKREKRVLKVNMFLILALVLAIFLAPTFVSTARYVYNVIYEHYLASKDFYFTSDKLTTTHTEYEVTNNWNGSSSYRITIDFSSKKNDKAFTEADVEYTVTFTHSDNITCRLSKTSGTIPGTGSVGVNDPSANKDFITIDIDPAGGNSLGSGQTVWVDVVATSTSPYRQTLSGKLVIETGSDNITYQIIDQVDSPYLTLNITNSGAEGRDIKLQYDPNVILLDMTSRFYLNRDSSKSVTQQINGYAYLNSVTSEINASSVYSVKFYKINKRQDYTYTGASGQTPIITVTY